MAPANSVSRPTRRPTAGALPGEVPGGVGEHEDADARHDEHHQGREAVDPHIEVEAELGDPGEALLDRLAVEQVGQADGQPEQRGHGCHDPERQAPPSEPGAGGDHGDAQDGVEEDQNEQAQTSGR